VQNTSGLTRLALAAAAAISLAACGGTKSVSQDTTPPGSTTVTALAVTSDGICAIVSGAAKCWGANSYGRLGDGTTKQRSKTVQVKGLEIGVTAITNSATHACAVVSGAAKCWGANDRGQLGNGTTSDSSTPVQVKGLESDVTAMSAGNGYTCAVVSGAAKCWGANDRGQLGNGTTSDSSTPVQVKGLETGVSAIAAALGHTCAVVLDAAKCWGYNFSGALGDGSDVERSTTPVQVVGLESGVSAVEVSEGNSCAVVSGAAKCWGYNLDGALGSGDTAYSTTPVQVVGLESGVTEISLGEGMTCAGVNGAVKCWGAIANFRCEKVGKSGSTCTDGISPTPVQVVGLESGATAIAAGKWYSCAVVSGAAKCWGKNFDGLVNGL
jgi:alpha-tubulin suppressor-like RCC1 family protein